MKKIFAGLILFTSITSFAGVNKRIQMKCLLTELNKSVLITLVNQSAYINELGDCNGNSQCKSVKQQTLASYVSDLATVTENSVVDIQNENGSIYIDTEQGIGELSFVKTSRRSDFGFMVFGLWKRVTEPKTRHLSKDIRTKKTKMHSHINCN